jgi:hypothetical protein
MVGQEQNACPASCGNNLGCDAELIANNASYYNTSLPLAA